MNDLEKSQRATTGKTGQSFSEAACLADLSIAFNSSSSGGSKTGGGGGEEERLVAVIWPVGGEVLGVGLRDRGGELQWKPSTTTTTR